ncbi:MAG: carboxypeptidase-like regulatory domain-containing protein [Candidatus Bathyarchaeia archaeon]
MSRKIAGALIIIIFVIGTLPTMAHGNSDVRTNVKPGLAFSQSVDVQNPGLVGNIWPNSVLAGSVGDVIFALSASGSICPPLPRHCLGWDTLAILVPPEFGNILPEQVVSTLTNNYANIIVRTLSAEDRYGPGWTIVSVTADGNTHHQFINFTKANEYYYIRINGVLAPLIAGTYFFKMYLYSTLSSTGEQPNSWVPTENWPQLTVNAEIDPASLTGTVRYGGYSTLYSGSAMQEAGRVWAHMTGKIDPSTGTALYSCPAPSQPIRPGCFDAMGYFNATANGQYDIEGIAAGTYDIYAQAAGYPMELVSPGVTMLPGQSLHFDASLNPGVMIHGDVYSKHQIGEQPWPDNSFIEIELYDQPTNNHLPDPKANLVSWSPLPCIAGGQENYMGGSHAGSCGDPRRGGSIAFPWHEYVPSLGYYAGPSAATPWFYQVATGPGNPLGNGASQKQTQDPQGVGPPQHWFVKGGSTDAFHFQFGSKAQYGAPRDLDGHVRQVFATWVNGLTPGRYYLRAWVSGYVQSGVDGSSFQEYPFDVTANQWAGDIALPVDLRLSSWVNETVYFHNLQDTQMTSTINTGAGYLYGALKDSNGAIWSFNVTSLGLTISNKTGTFYYRHNGYSTVLTKQSTISDPNDPSGLNSNSIGTGVAIIQFGGINDTWNGENYGIPPGTYNPMLWATGYLQATPTQVSVALSGNPTGMSDHLYRGAGFQVTISSVDWETPPVARNWLWNGQEIDMALYQSDHFVDALGDEPAFMANVALGGGCIKFGIHPLCPGSNLFQNSATNSLQVNGGGQNIAPNDNANWAFFGEEAEYQNVGGYTDFVLAPFNAIDRASFAYLPTAFPAGQYDLRAWTYGYVQSNYVSVYAQPGQVANAKINLIIGVTLSMDIVFKQEQIITSLPANASARVRFFDEQGRLAAEWMSSEGVYTAGTGTVKAADGTNGAPFGAGDSSENSTNYVPAGSTLLRIKTAGLPLVPASGSKITRLYYGDPVFRTPNQLYRKRGGFNFEVDEMTYPYFQNAGILGSPYYVGGWSVEVDMVNWYTSMVYYPPPDGLLLGESFHNIPGTTAKSGVSITEDAAISGTFIGHSMLPNHLGPYSQRALWLLLGPPSGGSSSGAFEIYIGQSGTQIPEFQTLGIVSFLVLLASLSLLRRKRVKVNTQRY